MKVNLGVVKFNREKVTGTMKMTVTPDGEKFVQVTMKVADPRDPNMDLVMNWVETVRQAGVEVSEVILYSGRRRKIKDLVVLTGDDLS